MGVLFLQDQVKVSIILIGQQFVRKMLWYVT